MVGGNFGVWGGLFATYDCAVKAVRKKEDPWNGIIAGFFVGGSLSIRSGWRHARNGAISCAILIGLFEGAGILIQKFMTQNAQVEAAAQRSAQHPSQSAQQPMAA